MKQQSRVLAGAAFGRTCIIKKFMHALGDITADGFAWLGKFIYWGPNRFRWVLPVGLGLVQVLLVGLVCWFSEARSSEMRLASPPVRALWRAVGGCASARPGL